MNAIVVISVRVAMKLKPTILACCINVVNEALGTDSKTDVAVKTAALVVSASSAAAVAFPHYWSQPTFMNNIATSISTAIAFRAGKDFSAIGLLQLTEKVEKKKWTI